ncbi:MAG: carbohydrate ABC transporter permease, partial [Clostridium sp.]
MKNKTVQNKITNKKSRETKDFWMFVMPCLFALVMVVIIPFLIGIYYTFTNWNGANPEYDFVGISNYIGLFKDTQFLYSFKITCIYTVASVVTINVIGFLLAYIVTRNL